jgi:hypothetical protein
VYTPLLVERAHLSGDPCKLPRFATGRPQWYKDQINVEDVLEPPSFALIRVCQFRHDSDSLWERRRQMKITFAAALSVGVVFLGPCAAQQLPSSAPTHIQNLQGCFRVSYRFVEDGKHDYEIKDFLEWITLNQQSGAYLIQHYGLFGGAVSEHFNEAWSLLGDGR